MIYLTRNDTDDLRITIDRLDYETREQFRVLLDAYRDLARVFESTEAEDGDTDALVATFEERSKLSLQVEDLETERDLLADELKNEKGDRADLRIGIDAAIDRLRAGNAEDALDVLEAL